MNVLHVTPEFYPLVKTGGLADVAAALPAALRRRGVDARVLLPGYLRVLKNLKGRKTEIETPGFLGHRARILAAKSGEVPVFVLDAPSLYDRPGTPYVGLDGKDYPDNDLRFAALARAAAWLARRDGRAWRPDVIHAHDWQAGLAPAYLALRPHGEWRPKTVFTFHNLAYQGLFPAERLAALDLPRDGFRVDGFEYWGKIGFLKAGLYYADALTTVSPTYSAEVQEALEGRGLQGLLRGRAEDFHGILNGVDYEVWNPASDPHLAAGYDADHLDRRAENKAALQARMGLDVRADASLFVVVSRLVPEKGMDLLLPAIEGVVGRGGQIAVLGAGDAGIEHEIQAMAHGNAGRVAAVIGYDESLAHLMQGGGDAIVVPSRSEPCGLTQLYGLRYGCLPVVRRTGGLADSVTDADAAALADGTATGFVFGQASGAALWDACWRAMDLYAKPEDWRRVQRNAMAQDFSWDASAAAYHDLYGDLTQV